VAVEWELEGERGRLADALAAVASHQVSGERLTALLHCPVLYCTTLYCTVLCCAVRTVLPDAVCKHMVFGDRVTPAPTGYTVHVGVASLLPQEREQGLEARAAGSGSAVAGGRGGQGAAESTAGGGGGGRGEPPAAEREALVGRAREEGRAQGRAEAERRAGRRGRGPRARCGRWLKEVKSLRRALGASQGEAARQRQQAEASRVSGRARSGQ